MTDQTKITRRRFLMVAGGAIGASALCCGGLATLGPRQMAVEFAESSCRQEKEMDKRILVAYASKCGSTGGVAEGDYRDWNAIRAWAGELVPVLIGLQ